MNCIKCQGNFKISPYLIDGDTKIGNNLSRIENSKRNSFRESLPEKIKKFAPLLLDCGHAVCVNCIKKDVTAIECPSCNEKTTIKDLVHQHYYVLGHLIINSMPNPNIINAGPQLRQRQQQELPSNELQSEELCEECGSQESERLCNVCKTKVCFPCFQKIHSPKTMQSHSFTKITSKYSVSVLECAAHDNKECSYVCCTCSSAKGVPEVICSTCHFAGDHNLHTYISLAEWNKKHSHELFELQEVLQEKVKKLEQDKKTCQKLLKEVEVTSEKVKSSVSNTFVRMHGQLQAIQSSVIDQLQETTAKNSSSLQLMILELEKNLQQAEKFLRSSNSVCEINFGSAHLFPLLKHIREFVAAVPFISSVQDSLAGFEVEQWAKVNFAAEPKIFTNFVELQLVNISNVLKLSKEQEAQPKDNNTKEKESEDEDESSNEEKKEASPVLESFSLASVKREKGLLRRPFSAINNQGTQVVSEAAKTGDVEASSRGAFSRGAFKACGSNTLLGTPSVVLSNLKKNEDFRDCVDSTPKGISDRQEQISPDSQKNSLSNTNKMKINSTTTIHHEEDIIVTDVEKTLETFHIQRKSDKANIEKLSLTVNQEAAESIIADNIAEGGLYLAEFSEDKCWYRAIATSESNGLFKVRFVDYGNVDFVPPECIRLCPDSLHTNIIPPYAYPCCLWGIEPISEEGFSQEAIHTFVELATFQQHIQFFVYSVESSFEDLNQLRPKCHVDIHCSCDLQSVSDDLPVSIRECFLFLEYGKSTLPTQEKIYTKSDGNMFWKRSFYKPSVSSNSSTGVQVRPTRIDSPSSFYVQICSYEAPLKILSGEMKEHYTSESVSKQLCWKIFIPKIGMLCVVKSKSDNLWLRALINDLLPGSRVLVTFVDTGEEEEVHYTSLRKIPDRFLKLPVQAIHCKLMNVVPLDDEDTWDEYSVQAFKDMVLEPESLLATFYKKNNEIYETSLMITQYNDEIDVARTLIDTDIVLADNEKISLTTVKTQALQFLVPEFSQNELLSLSTRRSIKRLNPLKKMPEVIIKPVERAGNSGILSICHLIDVQEVFSPSLIHTRRYSEREKFKEFQNELYNRMSSVDYALDANFRPSVGKTCVAKFGNKSPFFARVKLIEQNGSVFKSFLIDCGGIQDIEEKNLVSLPKSLNVDKSFCTVVTLAGINPPCGSPSWPTSTIDNLKTSLKKGCDIYMIKKGRCYRDHSSWNLKVLPVELGWMHEISGGPFEADDSAFISVKDILLNNGLALPNRNTDQEVNQSETSSSDTPMSADDSRHRVESPSEAFVPSNYFPPPRDIDLKSEINFSVDSIPEEDEPQKLVLPPQLPLSNIFKATVTNVDNDGNICLHTMESEQTLSLMMRTHHFMFGQQECSDKDLCWDIGDYVVAKYHLDKSWYRAQILRRDKGETEVHVEFIDYGNLETVNLEDIRTQMPFSNIPIQCYKCTLGIIPVSDNKWSEKTLDFLHEMIVMKNFEVTILEQRNGCVPRIEMKHLDKDELDVSDFFVNKMKVCKYEIFPKEERETDVSEEEGSLDIIIESDQSDEELFDVADLECPTDPSELIVVSVVSIIDPAFCYISPQRDLIDPVGVGNFWKQTAKALKAMNELQSYLQENFLRYKLGRTPQIGGFYAVRSPDYGDVFLRVKVLRMEEEKAFVKFIDFGNEDELEIGSFHIIPAKFRSIPSLAIKVHLQGVCSPGGKPWSEKAMNEMIKCLYTDEKIYASFNNNGNGDAPKVTLFFKDSDGRKVLCYKNLYDCNVIALV